MKFRGDSAKSVWLILNGALSLACLFMSPGLPVARAAEPTSPRAVLVLYWYGKDFPSNVAFEQSFQAALSSAPAGSVEYYAEYLESNRFQGEKQSLLLRNYLRQKYSDRKIDVVIAVSSPALNFLLKYRNDLFPRAPIVFNTISRPELSDEAARPGVTGVVVDNVFRNTLDVALKLHPSTDQAFVIVGTPERDKILEADVREELQEFEGKVRLTYLSDLPLDEMIARVKSASAPSIIFYVRDSQDEPGRTLSPADILTLVAQSANVPVYSLSGSLLGRGSVGGYATNTADFATKIAEITMRIVNGARPQDIPVVEVPSALMFDSRQLRRWRIREDRLPPGAVVRYKDPSIWDLYKWQIIGVASICIVEGLLIFALLAHRARRRRVEAALRDNEERLNLALSAANMGAWDWRLGANELTWSQEMRRIFGLHNGKSAVTPEAFFDLIHPDDRQAVSQAITKTIKQGVPYDIEFRAAPQNGTERWVMGKGKALLDDAGRAARMLGVNIDITERKRAEQALRESEERFRSSFHHAKIGMALVATDGRFLQVNRSVCELFGYSEEELLATDFQSLTHPDDLDANLAYRRQILAGEISAFQMEKRYIHKRGHTIWALMSVSLLRDGDGQPLYFISQIQDITESKQAEFNTQFINQLDFELSQISDADEIIRLATGRLGEYLGVRSCYVIEVNSAAGLAIVRENWDGWYQDAPNIVGEYRISDYAAPQLREELEAGRVVIVKDVVTDPRTRDFASKYEALGVGAFISIPVPNEKHWEASLTVNHPQARDWRPDETQLMRDITARLWPAFKRARAVAALRDSEQRFRQLAENIGAAFFITEVLSVAAPGRVLYVSPAYETIWGRSRESVYQDTRSWLDAVHYEDRERVLAALSGAGSAQFDEEFRIVRPDGEIRWVHDRVFPIRDECGEIYRLAGIVEDITRRKQFEEALRMSEDRFSNAFRSSPDAFTISRQVDGAIVDVNERWEEILGYTREEAVGRTVWELQIYPNPGERERLVSLVREQGSVRDFEADIRKKSGEIHNVLISAEPIKIRDEPCLMLIVRDITEQRQMQRALSQSQRRYTLASAAGRVGVWDWNLENNDIYVDPELKAILGYRDDEIRNHLDDWGSHVHPDDGEAVMAAAQDHIEGRAPAFEVEHRMIRKDGSVCWFLARGALIAGENGVRRIIGTDTDITELKRAVEALRRSEEGLRESHNRIEDLAGRLIVAQEEERKHIARELHDDLNQQVAALAIGVSRLKRQLPDDEKSAHDQIAKLRQKTDRLSDRIRTMSHQLHSSILQHVGLAAALEAYCAELAEQEGVNVALNIQDGVELIHSDVALCLYRVTQESLRNVVKHSGARSAEVALAVTDGGLELKIADPGVGFDPAEARKRSGLGLISMEERVRLLRGSFQLNARPGTGTVLKVEIPFRSEP